MKPPNRFMKFLGGYNLIYGLIVLILIGITIFVYHRVSFIFHPLAVIATTVVAPVILAFIAYYLLNPIVDLLEKIHIKRIWGIVIIVLGISGILTGIILATAPNIERQVNSLVENFPDYLTQLGDSIQAWLKQSFLGPYYDEGYIWLTDNLGIISD